MLPQIAISDEEISMCFTVLSELRTMLVKETFLETVRQMEKQGFRLAYLKDRENIVAVAGYRVSINLVLGKHLYIDDLVTTEKVRSKGFGKKPRKMDVSLFTSIPVYIEVTPIGFTFERDYQYRVFIFEKI